MKQQGVLVFLGDDCGLLFGLQGLGLRFRVCGLCVAVLPQQLRHYFLGSIKETP